MRFWRTVAFVSLVSLLAGCGGGGGGPATYSLTGTVTFDGKPVRIGTVMLMPDASANNQGPGASVAIKDGAFATESGRGHTGGKYIVQVVGYDGVPVPSSEGGMDPMGTQLFPPYDTAVDLPQGSHSITIDVPAAGSGEP